MILEARQQDYDIWSIAYPYSSVGGCGEPLSIQKNIRRRTDELARQRDRRLSSTRQRRAHRQGAANDNFSKVMKKVPKRAVGSDRARGVVDGRQQRLEDLRRNSTRRCCTSAGRRVRKNLG